jgi:opacity protein-like surface antigen
MRLKTMQKYFLIMGLCMGLGSAAWAETDVAASLYGAFTGKTTADGVAQSPANSAGGLIELRHISKPYIGYEATYSFNRGNQSYQDTLFACPVILPSCTPPTPASIKANAHEVTADWLASVKVANLRPFALAGGGLLFDVPVSGQTSTSTATKPVFVYGGGLDWGLLPHLGLRLQYRGNLYQAPHLSKLFTNGSTFTNTAEPMIGIYFRL